MSMEQQLQRLQARAEIQDLLGSYCRYADNHEISKMAALFVEDCIANYVASSDDYIIRGRDTLEEFFSEHQGNVISGSHFITNFEYLFNSDGSVTVCTYMYSWQRFKDYPVAADCHRLGRYEILIVSDGGEWKIAELRLSSSGEIGGARIGEQFGRPWPPEFEKRPGVKRD